MNYQKLMYTTWRTKRNVPKNWWLLGLMVDLVDQRKIKRKINDLVTESRNDGHLMHRCQVQDIQLLRCKTYQVQVPCQVMLSLQTMSPLQVMLPHHPIFRKMRRQHQWRHQVSSIMRLALDYYINKLKIW